MKRKICIVTSTRADWGLLSGIAQALNKRDDVTLQIIATNMHLVEKFGNTWQEIERDGLKINYKVPMPCDTDTANGTINAMGECMQGMSKAFGELNPDMLLILGEYFRQMHLV